MLSQVDADDDFLVGCAPNEFEMQSECLDQGEEDVERDRPTGFDGYDGSASYIREVSEVGLGEAELLAACGYHSSECSACASTLRCAGSGLPLKWHSAP